MVELNGKTGVRVIESVRDERGKGDVQQKPEL